MPEKAAEDDPSHESDEPHLHIATQNEQTYDPIHRSHRCPLRSSVRDCEDQPEQHCQSQGDRALHCKDHPLAVEPQNQYISPIFRTERVTRLLGLGLGGFVSL